MGVHRNPPRNPEPQILNPTELHWGYTRVILGLYWDNGKQQRSYCLGFRVVQQGRLQVPVSILCGFLGASIYKFESHGFRRLGGYRDYLGVHRDI